MKEASKLPKDELNLFSKCRYFKFKKFIKNQKNY